ncbi:peptidyl-prolyl cis-trans isomerase A (cyclophilin A) [Filimonas lacunae]|uniref:peptidylprolyl isomerase n=2 Tax=Filimonas lacunae TaxID=477680 RepID=A0A173MQQ5_9BACT|nr:peptidyl-prolyl cis-trans isomerase PpiA precursor [Filimonas lacunae]SIS82087.1 peptidyl-prolyl cis-trans isomerase A (cyclophilin A) [Filimonas lacunae]
MRNLFISLVVSCLTLAACKPKYKNPHVVIETRDGDIEIELYPDKAPKTVAAFLSYVDSGLYKNTSFYRVLTDDNQPSNAPKSNLIQGGLWRTNHTKAGSLPGIPHETTQQTGIQHLNGTVSLARTTPGSGTTEFFICVGDQPGFNYGGANNDDGQGYAAFGRVVKGMKVVKAVYNRPEDDQYFKPVVSIYNITRL